jgi:hypothetical protein
MLEAHEWTIAALLSVAIGVAMALADAPGWSYPVLLAALVAGVVLYQRQDRG